MAFPENVNEALEKLKRHRVSLEKSMTLDMTWLAHEMNRVGLISDDTHKDVINPRSMLSEGEKATIMVTALEKLVAINQHNLDKFVRILRNKSQLFEDIIDYLSSHGQDADSHSYQYSKSVAASKISSNTSSGSSSESSEVDLRPCFPYLLDENLPERTRSMHKMKLYKDSKDIKRRFASLIFDFQRSLEYSTCEVIDVVNAINIQLIVDDNDEETKEIMEMLNDCKTFAQIIRNLLTYISFFNFETIKFLIHKFGTPEIKKKLKKYKQKFRDYCKRRICECPSNIFDDAEETEKTLILKTELKMNDNLDKLEFVMNEALKTIGKKKFKLIHIEEGCVKLILRVLVGLSPNLTEEQQQSLRNNGILCLSYGDIKYDLQHLISIKNMPAKLGKISGDSGFISGSATNTTTLYTDTTTEEANEINPAEDLMKSAEPTGIDSRADLHNIIKTGDIDELKIAIKMKKYNPLSKDIYGHTALHTAALHGKLEVLKYLIEEEGLNASERGPQGTTSLSVAAKSGRLDIVRYLVEDQQVDPTDKDDNGYLPLHHACLSGSLTMVKYLFQKMKNVSHVESDKIHSEFTNDDTAPLHIAALSGNLDIVKYFFMEECGCDPNLANEAGKTALFFACEKGSLELVQYLIEVQHCQHSISDGDGNTPLHLAVMHGSLPVVQYLIEVKNCDAKWKNKLGNTPLLEASFVGSLEIVQYLIKFGCDPSICDNNGYNCLHAACRHGHLNVIEYLRVEQHMNPSMPTSNSRTNSLHIAASYGHTATVEYLCERVQLDASSKDDNGYAPLHLAVMNNHLEIVKYLINHQMCHPSIETSRNETALILAEAKGLQEIKSFLIKHLEKTIDTPGDKIIIHETSRGNLKFLKRLKKEALQACINKEYERTLIFTAVEYGHFEIVKYFVEEKILDPHVKDKFQFTLLHAAAGKGQVKIFHYLVNQCKCDPMCRSSDSKTFLQVNKDTSLGGTTPLHLAATYGYLKMVSHILESSYAASDPEVLNENGTTPLQFAAMGGHIDVIKYLIKKHKCDPSRRDKKLKTALYYAAAEGHLPVVRYLAKDMKCDPNILDHKRRRPIYMASSRGYFDVVKYLIGELKIDPNITSANYRETPLHRAALYGRLPIVKYLTQLKDCNISCQDAIGATALHLAAEQGHIEVVKHLTSVQYDCHERRNIMGDVPLHGAASNGHFAVVKFLVQECGTPPAVKNQQDKTPLHLALRHGHGRVALYLIVVIYNECRKSSSTF